MSTTYLSKDHFEIICTELHNYFLKQKDPPPNYSHTYFEKLESVIAIPQKTFATKDLYPTLFEKAACYLYFINKFHPFNNGNKRISIVATFVFLKLNDLDFIVNEDIMYKFAIKITKSHDHQDKEFQEVVEFIKQHTISSDFLTRLMSLMRLK